MPFGSLWIPVIVSAVVVFVASSILHMALKYHKADVKSLPNEDAVREALRVCPADRVRVAGATGRRTAHRRAVSAPASTTRADVNRSGG